MNRRAAHLLDRPLALLQSEVSRVRAFFDAGEDGPAAPTQPKMPADYSIAAGVGVIPIHGVLTHGAGWFWNDETSYGDIRRQLAHALGNPEVRAIALHINSPGGDVAGCFDLADAIFAMRGTKPIWAILDENAYSAGYALASAADRIIVPRTGGTGSIGVVQLHTDISGALDQAGIRITTITYGERKADGSSLEPLKGKALEGMQANVDKLGALFVRTVARNRGLPRSQVRDMEAGTFLGREGVEAGLADEVLAPDQAFLSLVASLPKLPSTGARAAAARAR